MTALVVVIGLVLLGLLLKFAGGLLLQIFGIVMVPDDSIAIVTKKFVITNKEKTLPDGHIVALKGEPGLQADTLPPGLYFWLWVIQFTVRIQKFTVVPQGMIGVVEAKDGAPMAPGRVLAKAVDCDSFQNARMFLENGGQRGPQIDYIRAGSYRINRELFNVEMVPAVEIPFDKIGIVTVRDGAPLDTGEIAGKIVPGHDRFQNGQSFVDGGGCKGLQEEVLLAGTHFINPWFAEVELEDLYAVPIGHVGVVVSYVGSNVVQIATAPAAAGAQFDTSPKHGRIVERGQKGVWRETLDPGKYPINRRTHIVELVPTTNIVLNWATAKSEAHNLDSKLSTITVRSKDGFAFNLDVSQIIHVPRDRASSVIARFGSMLNLVTQVLEPLIGNYFRNSAQTSDVIDFLQGRAERQAEAKEKIQQAIAGHDVEAVDTLIGDINPPTELMDTLTAQKVAERQIMTYNAQKLAQNSRQELMQATAEADTRGQVVQAGRDVEVAELTAQATVKEAEGRSQSTVLLAEAEAKATTLTGEAKAGVIEKVGTAEAEVQRKKVESIGPAQYAAINIAQAFAENGIALVPEISVSGGGKDGGGTGNGIVDAFIGVALRDRLAEPEATGAQAPVAQAPQTDAPAPAVTPPADDDTKTD